MRLNKLLPIQLYSDTLNLDASLNFQDLTIVKEFINTTVDNIQRLMSLESAEKDTGSEHILNKLEENLFSLISGHPFKFYTKLGRYRLSQPIDKDFALILIAVRLNQITEYVNTISEHLATLREIPLSEYLKLNNANTQSFRNYDLLFKFLDKSSPVLELNQIVEPKYIQLIKTLHVQSESSYNDIVTVYETLIQFPSEHPNSLTMQYTTLQRKCSSCLNTFFKYISKKINQNKSFLWKDTFSQLSHQDKLYIFDHLGKLNSKFPNISKWLIKKHPFELVKSFLRDNYRFSQIIPSDSVIILDYIKLTDIPPLSEHLSLTQEPSTLSEKIKQDESQTEKIVLHYKNQIYLNENQSYEFDDTNYLQIILQLHSHPVLKPIFTSKINSLYSEIKTQDSTTISESIIDVTNKMNIVLGKKTPHLKGKSYFELQELHEIIEALELSEYIEIPELISIASNYSQSVKDTKPPVACILKQSNAIVFYIREDLSISLQTYSKEALYKSCNLIDVQNLDSTFNKEKLNTLLTLFLEDVHDIDIDVYIILFKKNYQPPFHPEMESVQLSQALIKFYNISESLGLKDIKTRCLEKLSSLTSLEISPGHTSYLFKNELTSDSLSTTIIHADQRIITTVLRDLIDTPNLRKDEKITSLILKSIKKRGSFYNLMYNTLTCTLKTKAISTIFSFNQSHKINYFKIYDDIHDCLNLDDTSGTTFLEKILSDSDGLQWYTDTLNSIDNALLQFQITEFSIKDSLLKKEISSIKKLRSYLKSTYLKRQKRTQESLAFNIIIKDFQAILDTTFNRNFKFSMPFFSKVDTFIKDHELDSSTVANAIFSAYCLSNVDKVLVNLASIKKLSNETTTLSKQAQKFLLSFDPCSNLLRNPVNLQIKLAYFIDKFLHSLLLNTHAIDLEKVHLNLNMSFVCHYLDLDLNIPVINHRPFNYLDTDTINYDQSSNYPVDCVLKIYYQFKNHASKSSKMSSYEFWNAFINFQSTFKTLLECFNYNNTDFKTQKSILMYPLFNECSSFGEKLYRRSVPVLLSIFKDINNWFCSEAKNYLDFIPKQDLFKEFLDNILENSMLESRLLFLPVFLKSLESKMYKRLLTQQGSNPPLLRKKLENIVRFLRIETQDTLIDITESTNDIYSLYSHLDQLNTQLHHLSKDHSADSDIFYTQEELEDKQNQLLVKNCIELVNYIFNNINSVKLGKTTTKEVSSKQQDLTFNIIESHFFETIKQRSDRLDIESKNKRKKLLNQSNSSLKKNIKEFITYFDTLEDSSLTPTYKIQQELKKDPSWDNLASFLYQLYLIKPSLVSPSLKIYFPELTRLIYNNKLQINLDSFLSDSRFSDSRSTLKATTFNRIKLATLLSKALRTDIKLLSGLSNFIGQIQYLDRSIYESIAKQLPLSTLKTFADIAKVTTAIDNADYFIQHSLNKDNLSTLSTLRSSIICVKHLTKSSQIKLNELLGPLDKESTLDEIAKLGKEIDKINLFITNIDTFPVKKLASLNSKLEICFKHLNISSQQMILKLLGSINEDDTLSDISAYAAYLLKINAVLSSSGESLNTLNELSLLKSDHLCVKHLRKTSQVELQYLLGEINDNDSLSIIASSAAYLLKINDILSSPDESLNTLNELSLLKSDHLCVKHLSEISKGNLRSLLGEINDNDSLSIIASSAAYLLKINGILSSHGESLNTLNELSLLKSDHLCVKHLSEISKGNLRSLLGEINDNDSLSIIASISSKVLHFITQLNLFIHSGDFSLVNDLIGNYKILKFLNKKDLNTLFNYCPKIFDHSTLDEIKSEITKLNKKCALIENVVSQFSFSKKYSDLDQLSGPEKIYSILNQDTQSKLQALKINILNTDSLTQISLKIVKNIITNACENSHIFSLTDLTGSLNLNLDPAILKKLTHLLSQSKDKIKPTINATLLAQYASTELSIQLNKIVSEFKTTKQHHVLFELKGPDRSLKFLDTSLQPILSNFIEDFCLEDSLDEFNLKLTHKVISNACQFNTIFLLTEISGDLPLRLDTFFTRKLTRLLSQSSTQFNQPITGTLISEYAKKELAFQKKTTIDRYFSIEDTTRIFIEPFIHNITAFLPNFGPVTQEDYIQKYSTQTGFLSDINNQCIHSILNLSDQYLESFFLDLPTTVDTNLRTIKTTIKNLEKLLVLNQHSPSDSTKHFLFILGDIISFLQRNSLLLQTFVGNYVPQNNATITILNRILYLYCDFINTYFNNKD